MKIVLCEDEETSRVQMTQMLKQWGSKNQEPVLLLSYCTAEELLFKEEEWTDADGVILDIELKEMNGMELARNIRKRDEHIPILFVTGYEQYVFEGYEVGAVSYLMKPAKPEKLFLALKRLQEQSRRRKEVLLTNAGDENTRIYQADILYIESDGHYSTIHAKSEIIETKRSISELRGELKEENFFMPHRSYLVNVPHVKKITKKLVVMDNGEELPIARGKWEAVNQAYLAYYRRN